MRHDDTAEPAARGHAKVQIGGRVERSVGDGGQLSLRIVVNVQNGGPTFRINRCGRFTRLEQLDDALNGQDDARLGNVHDHANRGQCGY